MSDVTDYESLSVLNGDDKIIAQAKLEFKGAQDWESDSRTKFLSDLKFAAADPDNGWQWPGYLWTQRQDDPRGYKPRLTINKTRQHVKQIVNNIKQNPPGIKINPTGDTATFEAAQAWMGIVRHIERQSKASQAYMTALSFAVKGGIGYFRIVTQYDDPDSFDQEIYIRRIRNPLNVYLDPDANELDKSDSRFGFIFEDVPIDQFLKEYPKMRGRVRNTNALDSKSDGWLSKDHVRVAEYYRKEQKKDRLILILDPETKERGMARWSKIPKQLRQMIEEHDSIIQEREITEEVVKWYKIAADVIVDREDWPGKYIPIVPVIGEEEIIEGKLERKGHVRNLKDAQRMYNFWTSSAVEQVALQTKSKWFIPVGATENLETYYALINQQNYPYIPYNALDTDGNPLPAPTPIEPPTMAQGFIQGMVISKSEFEMVSGQNDENMGKPSNAIAGTAIAQRKQPGEIATYDYVDGLATAIAYAATIILDIAPKVYDTKQVKRLLARNGDESILQIDPTAQQPYTKVEDSQEGEIAAIFNPKMGRYLVSPDVGPGYETMRQEAWNAFVQITTQNRELVGTIGDIMFQYADFPGADEIAERLRRMVPPAALGQGPTPDLQAAQQANEQLKSLVTELTQKLADQDLKLKDKSEHNEIERQRANSDELKQVDNAKGSIDPAETEALVRKIVGEMMKGAGGKGNGLKPPMEGAEMGDDGSWNIKNAAGEPLKVVQ